MDAAHCIVEYKVRASRLETVFEHCFAEEFNTHLQGGFPEPLYQPPSAAGDRASIRYRNDYFASALHEVAHWCIAGPERRLLLDYGYWYAPDGRNSRQQERFENAEYKPQALEWFFARACDYPFRLSVDNLDLNCGDIPDTLRFREKVLAQAQRWQQAGLPPRGQRFLMGLRQHFKTDCDELLAPLAFRLTELN